VARAETAALVAQLTLDDKGFSKGISTAQKKLGELESTSFRVGQRIGGGLQSLGKNLAFIGVAAGGILTTQVVAGLRSLEKLETVTNQTAAVVESTGGKAGVSAEQVREYAESLEQLTTADDKQIQAAENMLLTFTNISKDAFPDATEAVVNLGIAMAEGDVANADFKSSAIQIGKALNDPIKGITALTRVGVTFTKQQKDQIKTLVESGDTLGAQRIILRELETEFGKAGEAAGTGFGADMRRVGDAVEDAQAALATGFLPVIQKVAKFLQTELAKPSTIKAIKEFGEGLAGSFDDVLAVAGKIPWAQIGQSLQVAGAGAHAILDAFLALPPWVQTAVITGWGLNKLTGGALTGIVGELGKGLIKGVLGINAGQVNIRAASVTGAGGGVAGGTAGATSTAGKIASAVSKVFILGAAAAFIAELGSIRGEQSEQNKEGIENLNKQTKEFAAGASLADLKNSLKGLEEQEAKLRSGIAPDQIAFQLDIDGIATAMERSQQTLRDKITSLEASGKTNSAAENTAQNITNERLEAIEAQKANIDAVAGAVRNSSVQNAAIATRNQAAAFAIRDKVATSGSLVAGAVNAVKSVAAVTTTATQTVASRQVIANERLEAIRRKDFSPTVNISAKFSIQELSKGQKTFTKTFHSTVS